MQNLLREFHLAFECPVNKVLTDNELLKLRIKLLKEETAEAIEAAEDFVWAEEVCPEELQKYKAKLLKELCDVVYVAIGMADVYGWKFDDAFKAVHASNMSKLGDDGRPIRREDGKILKGPNYQEPNLEEFVS